MHCEFQPSRQQLLKIHIVVDSGAGASKKRKREVMSIEVDMTRRVVRLHGGSKRIKKTSTARRAVRQGPKMAKRAGGQGPKMASRAGGQDTARRAVGQDMARRAVQGAKTARQAVHKHIQKIEDAGGRLTVRGGGKSKGRRDRHSQPSTQERCGGKTSMRDADGDAARCDHSDAGGAVGGDTADGFESRPSHRSAGGLESRPAHQRPGGLESQEPASTGGLESRPEHHSGNDGGTAEMNHSTVAVCGDDGDTTDDESGDCGSRRDDDTHVVPELEDGHVEDGHQEEDSHNVEDDGVAVDDTLAEVPTGVQTRSHTRQQEWASSAVATEATSTGMQLRSGTPINYLLNVFKRRPPKKSFARCEAQSVKGSDVWVDTCATTTARRRVHFEPQEKKTGGM